DILLVRKLDGVADLIRAAHTGEYRDLAADDTGECLEALVAGDLGAGLGDTVVFTGGVEPARDLAGESVRHSPSAAAAGGPFQDHDGGGLDIHLFDGPPGEV